MQPEIRIKRRTISILTLLCILGCVIVASPLSRQSPSASYASPSQDARDAVQDERLKQLDSQVAAQASTISALDSKINWMLGGIAGIYGMMALIGFVNLNLLRGKKL